MSRPTTPTFSVQLLLAAAIIAAAMLLAAVELSAQEVDPSKPISMGDAARLAAARGAQSVTARERAYQQGAKAMQVRAALLPTLTTDAMVDGGSNYTPTSTGTIPGGYWTPVSDRAVDMRIRVTQSLIDLPALRRYQAATADAFAAGLGSLATAENSARDGALAYLRVLQAQGTLAARLADSALAAELLDISRQQLTAGTAIALDVTRAESQLAGTVSQLITIRSDYARASLDLLQVLSLPLSTRLELADSLRAPEDDDLAVTEAEAVQRGLTRRADILSAEASIDAAKRNIGAVKAERLPVISFFAQAASTVDQSYGQKNFGIAVSMPIFDGFKREARIAEEKARQREAEVTYQDTRLRTEVEVRSAMLDLAAAKERVAATEVQLRLAEQEVRQAKERFKAGIAGNSDVIQASLTLNGARDQVVGALTAYHVARVEVAKAQGATTGLK